MCVAHRRLHQEVNLLEQLHSLCGSRDSISRGIYTTPAPASHRQQPRFTHRKVSGALGIHQFRPYLPADIFQFASVDGASVCIHLPDALP
jgi:hypothetical protein